MTAKKWARVKQNGAHGLRRGAWYPVVNDKKPDLLIVDVNKKNVPVSRGLVEVSDDAPKRWSVVAWDAADRGSRRASESRYGLVYGVCPACRARVTLEEQADHATCSECGGEFEVDWDHLC
ncbi:MAG: hypothetical protein JSW43_07750 [Gemmatimonadota bacterium]|nr:MAG: hypothetical protein JSW43_07750 [Gemmatimonadota bacterium]